MWIEILYLAARIVLSNLNCPGPRTIAAVKNSPRVSKWWEKKPLIKDF
jgi:hypothetical protein